METAPAGWAPAMKMARAAVWRRGAAAVAAAQARRLALGWQHCHSPVLLVLAVEAPAAAVAVAVGLAHSHGRQPLRQACRAAERRVHRRQRRWA